MKMVDTGVVLEMLEESTIPMQSQDFAELYEMDPDPTHRAFTALHSSGEILPVVSEGKPFDRLFATYFCTTQNLRVLVLDIVRKHGPLERFALFRMFCDRIQEILPEKVRHMPLKNEETDEIEVVEVLKKVQVHDTDDDTSISFDRVLFLLIQTTEIVFDAKNALKINSIEGISSHIAERAVMGCPLVLTKEIRILEKGEVEKLQKEKREKEEQKRQSAKQKQKEAEEAQRRAKEFETERQKLAWLEI